MTVTSYSVIVNPSKRLQRNRNGANALFPSHWWRSWRVNNHASEVIGRGFVGARSNVNGRKVVAKTLLPIRKTPCAYTQNTLRLYAKFPRLNAKTNVFFRRLSLRQAARMPTWKRPEGDSSCFPRATPWENRRGNHHPEGAKANC